MIFFSIAKVVAGTTKLEFTKIKVSDTKLSGDLASMTGIGTIKQEEKVASVVRKNGSNVTVSASFSNQTLGQGYYVRNLGLYANDPQAGEILYSISVADESTATADYMPPFNGIGVSSLMVDLVTAVSNASSVKVNVDPTAGATVAQIVNLQEQIDDVKSFVGYESSDVYGVEIDFPNRRFTRIAGAENLTAGADFDKLNPWGGRKRCILADDGTVLAYRGETGYTEAGATTVELKKTVDGAEKTYASGTKVQVMVEQPVFYVKAVPVSSKNATSGKGTSGLGNGSGIDPNGGVDGKCSVSYRGEENLWGNIWTWLDKVNILAKGQNEVFVHEIGATVADDTTTGYKSLGYHWSHSNGYQSAFGIDPEHPELLIPTEASGSDVFTGNFVWQNYTYNGFFIAVLGGMWNSGSYCGFYLSGYSASGGRVRGIGGRLLYVPQTKVA